MLAGTVQKSAVTKFEHSQKNLGTAERTPHAATISKFALS